MKMKDNRGFSLVEMLVAIVLLAALVIPTCTGLTLSLQMNARSQELMQSQLAVSSVVESLMEAGVTNAFRGTLKDVERTEYPELAEKYPEWNLKEAAEYPQVLLLVEPETGDAVRYYNVTVVSRDGLVEVQTAIRAKQEGSP